MGRPTLFSMLIIIIAHLPIFTLQRQEGRIFAPMAYTIVSALIGSLLFSLTLVPLLAFFLLRRGVPHGENCCRALAQAACTPGSLAGPCAAPCWFCSARSPRWAAVSLWSPAWAASFCPN